MPLAKLVLTVCGSALLVALQGCAAPSPAQPSQPFILDLQDDDVSLSIPAPDGLPIEDFLKISQRVTGKTFTYSRDELEQAEHGIRLIGTVKMKREEFFAFVQTMLHANGFRCDADGDVVRVKRVAARVQELIRLEHADCKEVLASLRGLNEGLERGSKFVVVAHEKSNSLLMSGERESMVQAKDLIAMLDRPDRPVK